MAMPPNAGAPQDRFWDRPIETLSRDEWEALCDGCGKCCLHKLEDEDTGEVYHTNVACRLLDTKTARCSDYRHRRAMVPDCLRLTPRLVTQVAWLPATCAYRLRAAGEPLPAWHYLESGDRQAVHRAGVSVVGKAISEVVAGPLENHIVSDVEWDGDAPGSPRAPIGFRLP
ncbi:MULTISPECIES: YcgN family cysteine cluster protein [unclassified Novosphingobium]|uniref:YcgN family cysteine cluster protein n=1 Tax=unclassified Novosphingobium TaxID=2644732 RepID=UPI001E486207|nr:MULTISPECIES: YcgN family cysteine cluster protein [unclassified Novosphingobium]